MRVLARLLPALVVPVALLAMAGPLHVWLADRVEPRVLGLPFAFAWNVGWLLATSGALAIHHLVNGEREED